MKIIKENVFVVKEITDGHYAPVIGYFSNKSAADKVKYLVGGYGGETFGQLLEYVIFESFEEYMSFKSKDLKKSALNKLTKEEKLALGL